MSGISNLQARQGDRFHRNISRVLLELSCNAAAISRVQLIASSVHSDRFPRKRTEPNSQDGITLHRREKWGKRNLTQLER